MMLPLRCAIMVGSTARLHRVGAVDVDSHELLPARGVDVQNGLAEHHGASIVEQDIDFAVTLNRLADHVIDLRLIGYVAVDGQNVAAGVPDVVGSLAERARQAGGGTGCERR